jgi:tRNA (guanine-N7-)-methyltransferase
MLENDDSTLFLSARSKQPIRPIRSFVRRTGRITAAQSRALTAAQSASQGGWLYLIPPEGEFIDFTACFGGVVAPVILEIGFGMGEATAHIAAHQPHHHFLACEVHQAGVGALLDRIDKQQLTNIRVVAHDAVEVLKHHIAPKSLSGVHLFFPDPWHKKRHHKRRLVQASFVDLLVSRLGKGAMIHAATDWLPYGEQIRDVLAAHPSLRNTSQDAEGFVDKPGYRPLTKFEQRGLRLGHRVVDVVFELVA